jgi:hypothetical protein
MKTFAVKTRFSFTGMFYIKADSGAEAKDRIMNDCGLVMGRGIHTGLSEELVNWDFPIHPEKRTGQPHIVGNGTVHDDT